MSAATAPGSAAAEPCHGDEDLTIILNGLFDDGFHEFRRAVRGGDPELVLDAEFLENRSAFLSDREIGFRAEEDGDVHAPLPCERSFNLALCSSRSQNPGALAVGSSDPPPSCRTRIERSVEPPTTFDVHPPCHLAG